MALWTTQPPDADMFGGDFGWSVTRIRRDLTQEADCGTGQPLSLFYAS